MVLIALSSLPSVFPYILFCASQVKVRQARKLMGKALGINSSFLCHAVPLQQIFLRASHQTRHSFYLTYISLGCNRLNFQTH